MNREAIDLLRTRTTLRRLSLRPSSGLSATQRREGSSVCNQNSASEQDDSSNYQERSRGYRVSQHTPNKNKLTESHTKQGDAIKNKEVS